MSATEPVYQVAVPAPIPRVYDYLGPEKLLPGTRVRVPFGARKLVGMVVSCQPSRGEYKLKSILQVLDSEPVLDRTMLRLLLWVADYYHHPIGEVLATGMPRKLQGNQPVRPPMWTQAFRWSDHSPEEVKARLSKSPAQRRLYQALSRDHWQNWTELAAKTRCKEQTLYKLLTQDLVEQCIKLPKQSMSARNAIRLNPEQQQAVDQILTALGGYQTFLLQGITGSGKTEVYFEVARRVIASGKQVLLLVPEISLTAQMIARAKGCLGESVRSLHSGLSDQERYDTWWLAKTGQAAVILGTRSAVFIPLQHPGLIIVDEEHDSSYKQGGTFRYHARSLAIKRASISGIPLVLGSATPSLESLHNVQAGRHRHLRLHQRYGDARLPTVRIIDCRIHPPVNGLTPPLLNAIDQRIERGEQTILYINRRGYAPIVRCFQCGWEAHCRHCSARLVYHRQTQSFRCHICDHTQPAGDHCPSCDHSLSFSGAGTQRLEQALYGQFPGARLCRLDRDEASTTHKLYAQLERIRQGEIDVVIGTRMITKGHDFSRVTLVGVVNADQGLYNVDFRATEYMFQELLQVAGRSGRAESHGEVLIQTAYPDHPTVRLLSSQNYMGFVQMENALRSQAGYPPFSYLALFRAKSRNADAACTTLRQIAHWGKQILQDAEIDDIDIFTPVPALLEKKAGQYRMQLLIRTRHRGHLHYLLSRLSTQIGNSRFPPSVRWSLDVDPLEML